MTASIEAFSEKVATRKDWESLLGVTLDGSDGKIVRFGVTPTLARALRANYKFRRQRPLIKPNIASIANDLTRGTYRNTAVGGLALQLSPDDDSAVQVYVINGNHTLEGIAAANVGIDMDFKIHVVQDEEEAASWYASYDIGKSRNLSAITRAYGGQKLKTLGKDMQKILQRCSAFGIANLDPDVYSTVTGWNNERVKWQIDHVTEATQVEDWFERMKKQYPDFYKDVKRIQFPALILSILKKGTDEHRAKVMQLLADLELVTAGDMEMVPFTGLHGMLEALQMQAQVGSMGRAARMYSMIRSWEAIVHDRSVPTMISDRCNRILLSEPVL